MGVGEGFYKVLVRCMVLIVCAWHDVECDWLMLMKVWTSFLLRESFMGLWPIISTGLVWFRLVFCLWNWIYYRYYYCFLNNNKEISK